MKDEATKRSGNGQVHMNTIPPELKDVLEVQSAFKDEVGAGEIVPERIEAGSGRAAEEAEGRVRKLGRWS
jgi:hypothetical protein